MRKKSHVTLAIFLVKNINIEELTDHKRAFYLGNILPDCKPSFLTQRHEYFATYDKIKESIRELTEDCNVFTRNARVYWRRLGEVIHYMADYFTFPHNITFPGNLREHCAYEQQLKLRLREYIKSGEARKNHNHVTTFRSINSLFKFIEEKHAEYLTMQRNIEDDCRYITSLCQQVVYSMIHLLNEKLQYVLFPALA